MISSRNYSWYDKIRVEDWWNKTQVVKHDVSKYNIIMIITQKFDVKSDESILGKAYNRYIVCIFYYYYSSDPYI